MKKTNSSMSIFLAFGAAVLLVEWMLFSFGYASTPGASFDLKSVVIGLTIPLAFISWGLFIRFPKRITLALSVLLSIGAIILFIWFVVALVTN